MTETSDYLLDSSREYAIYVCNHRAIPSVSDGLKNGQRMALWVLRNRAEKMKTFALTGMLGAEKLFVHGEASCNNAISLLAAPYRNNHCLIEGLGQFGSRIAPDGDGIGAPRYTEVRRSAAAQAFLYHDLDLVPLIDNYDGSNKQPEHFLPIIPVVLLNGVSGVAVGWSTDILPRSLKSIVEATKAALMGTPLPALVPYYAKYNITVKSTGKPNQWEYSGRATILDSSTIKITEIPPGMPIENFRKHLIEMEDNDEIMGFSDRSTEFIDITVKMKRGSVKDWTEQKAIDFFKIKEKTTERIVVIDWSGNSIRTYSSPEELVVDFVKWRLGWYTTRFKKLVRDNSYELQYWYALRALFVKNFVSLLGTFANKNAVEIAVKEITNADNITIDVSQLEKIVNLPTYRWANDFALEIDKKIAELETNIANYKDTLASPEKLRQVYYDEIDALKGVK
jgi:DNA gyrase/topoisomerase IV subunit A